MLSHIELGGPQTPTVPTYSDDYNVYTGVFYATEYVYFCRACPVGTFVTHCCLELWELAGRHV